MDKGFFERKIKELTNDKLIDLLQKTENKVNSDIFDLAKKEADFRNLQFSLNKNVEKQLIEIGSDENEKLKKWNWGAFLLAPIWTLAHKLEKWTILWFVPGVNDIVIFYLGINGNRLAFEKSSIKSIDDFITVQKDWGRWSVRLIIIGIICGLFSMILTSVTS